MKPTKKPAIIITLATVTLLFVFVGMLNMSFTSFTTGDKKPWVVPAKDKAIKNPLTSDAESIAAGKKLYTKLCKSCHGVTGKGDGPKSKELETPTGDFSEAAVKANTDGELFYKIKNGRDDMPSFKNEAETNDIWQMVIYVRTLQK